MECKYLKCLFPFGVQIHVQKELRLSTIEAMLIGLWICDFDYYGVVNPAQPQHH